MEATRGAGAPDPARLIGFNPSRGGVPNQAQARHGPGRITATPDHNGHTYTMAGTPTSTTRISSGRPMRQ